MPPNDVSQEAYCAFCGSPLSLEEDDGHVLYQERDPDRDDDDFMIGYSRPCIIHDHEMEWLEDFHLIGRACNRTDGPKNSPSKFRNRLAFWAEGYFINLGSSKKEVYRHDAGGFAYFPVHIACLSIAERIFEQRRRRGPGDASDTGRGTKPTCLESLYDRVNRQSHDDESPRDFHCAVNWPHGYYGAQACQGQKMVVEAGRRNRGPSQESGHVERPERWLCADPVYVPDLTNFILSHLQPVRAKDDDDVTAAMNNLTPRSLSPPECLPTDLLDHTASYLSFADTLALARISKRLHQRLLTQKWWREALIAGDAVGYLWDLDPVHCRTKDTDTDAAAKPWDWRALARQLAARDCFDDAHAGFKHTPRGLRNRQRIWKILLDV
ncbi:MAG: hypothetical protein M1826_007144 [Phylliscum demangeonii]|nr:MAG: hypothetical protein M1826_007144 [Phylliscum demangeonii]